MRPQVRGSVVLCHPCGFLSAIITAPSLSARPPGPGSASSWQDEENRSMGQKVLAFDVWEFVCAGALYRLRDLAFTSLWVYTFSRLIRWWRTSTVPYRTPPIQMPHASLSSDAQDRPKCLTFDITVQNHPCEQPQTCCTYAGWFGRIRQKG